MDAQDKRIRRIFWAVLLVGSAALGVCIARYDLSGAGLWIPAAVWLLLVAAGAVAIDLMWYRALGKRLDALMPILTEEQDPERYIRELEALLAGKRSRQLRQIRLINLAAAHCWMDEEREALELLLQVERRGISGLNRAVYWVNLATVYFLLGETEKACAILAAQRESFARLRALPYLAADIAKLDVFALLAQGEGEAAARLLAETRGRFSEGRHGRDFDRLEALCRQARGESGGGDTRPAP